MIDENSSDYRKIMSYVDRNPAAVVGTVDESGNPHGAVVYVCTATGSTLCFVTKNQTLKYHNLVERPHVSLTFFDTQESSTLQASGHAFVIEEPAMIDFVMEKMHHIMARQVDWLPPISKIRAGEYVVIGVKLNHARLAEYSGQGIGSQHIFTEL